MKKCKSVKKNFIFEVITFFVIIVWNSFSKKFLARALLYSRLFSIYEIACNIKSCKVMVQKVTLEDK